MENPKKVDLTEMMVTEYTEDITKKSTTQGVIKVGEVTKYKLSSEIKEWLIENEMVYWLNNGRTPGYIVFNNVDDAVWFKMVWFHV